MKKKKRVQKDKIVKPSFEKWMGEAMKTLTEVYGLGDITILVHKRKNEEAPRHNGACVIFSISYSNAYKTANIWYGSNALSLFKRGEFTILRQAITHEIAHILTNPVADLATNRYINKREMEDAIENLTESLGHMARKLLDAKNIKMM